MIIYMMRGRLPWHDLDDSQMIMNQKISMSAETLCEGLPEEFSGYIRDVRDLNFDVGTKHKELRRGFQRLFRREGFEHDNIFDWTVRKFHEHEAKQLAQQLEIEHEDI